jgi:hypothetical protein
MMMTDALTAYTNLLAAMRAENDEVTEKLFHPDFTIHEDPGMPYGAEAKGGANFLALRRKVYATWGPKCLELQFKTSDPSGKHATGFFKLFDRRPGKSGEPIGHVSLVWTFENGLAREVYVIYYDTPRLSKALAEG